MKNPWLDIPLCDYEAHMALPHVAQAGLLGDVLTEALDKYTPRSVAVLGCAGGNGFERVAASQVQRLVGIDINLAYVAEARRRFRDVVPGLQLFAGDLEMDTFEFDPVDLVFAALLFEYVDTTTVLDRIRPMFRPGGVLVSVLQLPDEHIAEVTPSPYTSLETLASVMHLVAPAHLAVLARDHGYREGESSMRQVPGGKRFQVQSFTYGIDVTPK